MIRYKLLSSAACVVLLQALSLAIPTSSARAQAVAPASAEEQAEGNVVGEIIVTAQKRAERVQDVPLSIVAVGEEQLRENHITQIQDLRLVDPSVQYRVSNGKINSAFSMRGVGTQTFAIGIEQSVAMIVDGVSLGDPAAVATLSDIDHVEILKGPQGMLFGKNASAGVISIITKNPRIGEFSGDLHASFGKNDEQIIEASLNVPISDTLALRLSAMRNHLQGWITDPALGGASINNIDDNGLRAKLLWRPNDRLKVVLASDYAYDGEFCCTQVQYATPNPQSGAAVSNALYGVVAGPDNFQVTFGKMPEGKARTLGVNLNVDYDLGGNYIVTSIASYRSGYHFHSYDADLSVFDYVDVNGGHAKLQTLSEELRIASPPKMASPLGGQFDYVAGIYLYSQNGKSTIGDQIGYVVAPALGTVTIPTNTKLSTVTGYNTVGSKSLAAFGQVNYDLNDFIPGLNLIAGGRLTRDDVDLLYQRGPALGVYSGLVGNGPLVPGHPLPRIDNVDPLTLPLRTGNQYIGWPGPFIGTSNSSATGLSSVGCVAGSTIPFPTGVNCFPGLFQTVDNTNFSYRVTLQEKFTRDVMAYATYARGYKGPGVAGTTAPNFTTAGGVPPFSTNPEAINQLVKPEIPLTVEVGLKSQWFDRRLQINGDVFVSTFKNYQTQTNVPTPNGFVGRVANAESLDLKGFELNTAWAPTDNLRLGFAGTWEKGTYGDLPVPCIFQDSSLKVTNGVVSAVETSPTGGVGCGVSVPDGKGGFVAGQLNAKGNPLTGLPRFQYRVSANYEAPNLIGGLTGYFNSSWNWQSKVYFNPNHNEIESQKPYGLLNAEIGLGKGDGRWRVSLYGSNILDQNFSSAINIAPTSVLNPAGYYRYVSPQAFAHYGIRLDASF